jgi:HSP20 family molecular chaperone IbpA
MTEDTVNYFNKILFPEKNYCSPHFNNGVEILTLEDSYEALIVIPGSEKEEISISACNDFLEVKSSNSSYPYEYKLKLSKLVDVEKISSSLRNGILKIKLPKRKPQNADKFRIPVS